MAHGDLRWTEILPIVLLGLRTAWKADLQCSSAEMVYGEALRIPGEFFQPTPANKIQPVDFVSELRRHISNLKPVPASRHSQKSIFIHKDLQTSTHVFLRNDHLRGALEPPYVGPLKVLKRTDKTVTLDLRRGPVTVSIDRVKPAYVLSDDNMTSSSLQPGVVCPSQVVRTTRSGRKVTFPDFYVAGP